ncbi:pilus assembly protein N-terminal domain-containing protein [Parvularcula marina]|uniref:pilus assembly protein N-terminal domain-containing protein n=1 Tax=Parvularcula marina TaxID=2292771 RepID=UPI00351133B9
MKTSASVFFSLAALFASAEAGEMWVTIDHARLHQTDRAIGSIIVGNPSVADVTVKSSTEIILFGITPGSTNVSLFSPEGEKIETLTVAVRNPTANRLTLQAGDMRYSFACTNVCEQVPAVGDGSNDSRLALGTIDAQAANRLAAARNAANTSIGMPTQPTDPFMDSQSPEAADAEDGQPGS